nr:MAG: hypothetical protein TU35_05750 [Thermoproteus sp. AZ2]
MYIELFVISGRSQQLEESLKKAVEDIRSKVERRDRVRLATIKIRQDAADQILKFLDQPVERVPPHFRSLVSILKRYNVAAFPAVIVDGQKILEGREDVDAAVAAVYKRANEEFGISLQPAAPTVPAPPKPVEAPQPTPTEVQPPPPPPSPPPRPIAAEVRPLVEAPPTPEAPPVAPPPPPPPKPVEAQPLPPRPSVVEVQPSQPSVVAPPPPPPPATKPLPSLPAKVVVRLVLGRPDNCAECAYFGEATSRCYLFGLSVADPARPPCKNVGG